MAIAGGLDRANSSAAPGLRRVIGAATVGNVLEWYDWAAYGYLVIHIGAAFFPSDDPAASLLLTFATYGVGFVTRPLGAVVVGWIGEVHGRRAALMTTFFVMAIATALIAFIPTYAAIGIWAPICLIICRMLQGFSTGGELGGSLAFMIEWAPDKRRGLYASFQQVSTIAGLLLGSGVAALMNTLLTPEDMAQWGWRVPFLIGGVLLPIGVWVRSRIVETPLYIAAKESNAPSPSARTSTTLVLRAIGIMAAPVAGPYLVFTYFATYAVTFGGLTQGQALWSNTIGLIIVMLFTPLMGAWSDRIGRRPMLLTASAFFLVGGPFIFDFAASMPGFIAIMQLQVGLGVVIAVFHGVCPVTVTELFPTRGRSLLLSIAYAVGIALAGGFAPFIATWLIAWTGSNTAPAYYLAAMAMVTIATVLTTRETAHGKLA
jgi:MHS family proline/betaine transporter-like MFS transporter